MNIKAAASALSLALLATFLPLRAQTLINGSFESPVIPTTTLLGVLSVTPGYANYSGAGITGWNVTAGTVTLVDAGPSLTTTLGLFKADDGTQYVVLNNVSVSALGASAVSGTSATLTQDITNLTIGQKYEITFDVRGLSVGLLNGTPYLDVSASNSSGSTAPANGTLAVGLSVNSWVPETFTFTATGTSSLLTFNVDNGGTLGTGLVALDDVGITPVPEPAQTMAAAFGFLALLIAGRLLRRKTVASDGEPALPETTAALLG